MSFQQALHALFNDNTLIAALILVAVDFVLGVAAAFAKHTFKLSYIGDFASNDLLQKLLPWGVLYVGAKLAPSAGVGFLDLGAAAGAIYVLIIAAWTGSILASLTQLGLPIKVPGIAAPEKT